MTDAEAMWKVLEKWPEDSALKGALADCLRESGDSDTAAVLQWCRERKRWPALRDRPYWQTTGPKLLWTWGFATRSGSPKQQGNGLLKPVFGLLPKPRQFRTVREAVAALTAALVTLRDYGPRWQ